MSNVTIDQSGQTVTGTQVNAAGDVNIERYTVEYAQINLPPDLLRRLLANGKLGAEEDFTVAALAREPWEPDTVFVPAGPFTMGSRPGEGIPETETPEFTPALPAYRIGKFPVTNEQYAHYIWQTRQVVEPELKWVGNKPAEDELDFPVSGVTWYEALAYCQWLSEATGRVYTLPTEAQWEKAARYNDDRLFPWSGEWDPARCNTDGVQIRPVDAFPPQNELGCHDLVGNVREWTLTAWGEDPHRPLKRFTYPREDDKWNGVDEPSTTRRIYRGGRAREPRDYRVTARGSYLPDQPGPKSNRHGFRVVLLPIE